MKVTLAYISFLACVLCANAYTQEAILSVNESYGIPGSSNNPVEIELSNPISIAGVQFTLKFDGNLLNIDSIYATPRASFMNLGYNIWPDSVKVIIYSITGDSILLGGGPIVGVLFDVSEGAIPGDSTLLHLKDCVLSDPSAHSIPCTALDGWFCFVVTPTSPILLSPEDDSFLSDSIFAFIWSAVDGASRYWLQIDDDSSFLSPIINDSTLTDSIYTPVTGLPNMSYYWRVRAGNRFEWSNWSSVWHFEIDTQSPTAPALVSPPDSGWLNDTTITFEWSEVAKGVDMKKGRHGERENISDLRVLRGQNPKSSGSKASPIHYILQVDTTSEFNTPIADTISVTYDTLNLDEYLYYWRVKAYDEAGNDGSFSQAFWFVVDTTSPVIDSTTQLVDTVAFFGPFVVNTKIADNFALKGGLLEYRVNNSPWIADSLSPIGSDWYTAEIVEQEPCDTMVIVYNILASDYADNISRDPEEGNYSFTILLTGIQETRDIPDKFVLFSPKPNPSVGIIEIQYGLPEKTNISLRIYDIQGRLVKSIFSGSKDAGYYRLRINSKDLSSGIYFLRFEAEGYNTTRKLLILR